MSRSQYTCEKAIYISSEIWQNLFLRKVSAFRLSVVIWELFFCSLPKILEDKPKDIQLVIFIPSILHWLLPFFAFWRFLSSGCCSSTHPPSFYSLFLSLTLLGSQVLRIFFPLSASYLPLVLSWSGMTSFPNFWEGHVYLMGTSFISNVATLAGMFCFLFLLKEGISLFSLRLSPPSVLWSPLLLIPRGHSSVIAPTAQDSFYTKGVLIGSLSLTICVTPSPPSHKL